MLMDRKSKYFDIPPHSLDNINLDYLEMSDVTCVKEYHKHGPYLTYGLPHTPLSNDYHSRVKNMS